MGTVYNVESNQFIENAIQLQTERKTGQYSKYLNAIQYFCEYFSINKAHSRTDIGTGATYNEIGPDSPIRYNRINNFPLYIKGELIPNITYEDGLADTDIELSDIAFPPNTIIPKPGDFIRVQFPHSPVLLFIVNEYKNVTIQSNNFYQATAALRLIDKDCYKIDKQVIEKYNCIFDNIGTQDNCIIRDDLFEKSEIIKKSIEELSGFYHDMYYDKTIGTFVYNDLLDVSYNMAQPAIITKEFPYESTWYNTVQNFFGDGQHKEYKNPDNDESHVYYDVYLIKFIKDSDIFFDNKSSMNSSAIAYDDFNPPNFDLVFRQSLWYAILKKSILSLNDYMYYFNHTITKMTSALLTQRKSNPTGFTLINTVKSNIDAMESYISNTLIDFIKHGKPEMPVPTQTLDVGIENTNLINIIPLMQNTGNELVSDAFPDNNNTTSINIDSGYDDPKYNNTFDFIYNYMTDGSNEIDYNLLFSELMNNSLKSYWLVPLVLYIMKQQYNLIVHRVL